MIQPLKTDLVLPRASLVPKVQVSGIQPSLKKSPALTMAGLKMGLALGASQKRWA